MRIPTTEACRDCGKTLSQDLETFAYSCESGHEFATLPALNEPVAVPFAPPAEAAPATVTAAPIEGVTVATVVTPSAADLDATVADPPPCIQGYPPLVAATPEAIAQAAPIAESALQQALEAATEEVPPQDSPFIPQMSFTPEKEPEFQGLEEGTIQADGADLLIVVRIPDPHAATLQALADSIPQPFAEFIRDNWRYALDNNWLADVRG